MNILITGANGFIGRNLFYHIQNKSNFNCKKITKKTPKNKYFKLLNKADIIFHFAGSNREKTKKNFYKNNIEFTKNICNCIKNTNKKIKLIYTSTIQINQKNTYGITKKKAENELLKLQKKNKNINLNIYRLPNIFGKWAKPNYNSVVSTFCNKAIKNEELKIIKNEKISLVYIDDLVKNFLKKINGKENSKIFHEVNPKKKIFVKELANKITKFNNDRMNSLIPNIKNSFDKKIYSTLLSFIDQKKGFYTVKKNFDDRGEFTELFKNSQFGQISFFSINQKKTRGQHYHHTKTEKFYLISGKVKFEFKHILNKNKHSIIIDDKSEKVVMTIPGWSHKIKNIGTKKALFVSWVNEIFDIKKPDTYYYKV